MSPLPASLPAETPRRETVHHKPVMDSEGNWSTAAFAHWRDEQGRQHDRPLLTAEAFTETPTERKA